MGCERLDLILFASLEPVISRLSLWGCDFERVISGWAVRCSTPQFGSASIFEILELDTLLSSLNAYESFR
jgi:hypothetical protein